MVGTCIESRCWPRWPKAARGSAVGLVVEVVGLEHLEVVFEEAVLLGGLDDVNCVALQVVETFAEAVHRRQTVALSAVEAGVGGDEVHTVVRQN